MTTCLSCGGLASILRSFGLVRLVDGKKEWSKKEYPLCLECDSRLPPREKLPHYRAFWLATEPSPADMCEWFTPGRSADSGEPSSPKV